MMRTVTVVIEIKYLKAFYIFYSQFGTTCWKVEFLHKVLEFRIPVTRG